MKLHAELSAIEKFVNDCEEEDENELLSKYEDIMKMSNRTKNFINYELELNLLSLKMGIKDEYRDDLADYFLKCLQVDVEYASMGGSRCLSRIPDSKGHFTEGKPLGMHLR